MVGIQDTLFPRRHGGRTARLSPALSLRQVSGCQAGTPSAGTTHARPLSRRSCCRGHADTAALACVRPASPPSAAPGLQAQPPGTVLTAWAEAPAGGSVCTRVPSSESAKTERCSGTTDQQPVSVRRHPHRAPENSWWHTHGSPRADASSLDHPPCPHCPPSPRWPLSDRVVFLPVPAHIQSCLPGLTPSCQVTPPWDCWGMGTRPAQWSPL